MRSPDTSKLEKVCDCRRDVARRPRPPAARAHTGAARLRRAAVALRKLRQDRLALFGAQISAQLEQASELGRIGSLVARQLEAVN